MSVSARHHRSVNFVLWSVISLGFCFALALPGIVRGQPITEGFNNFDTGTRPAGWTFVGCNANSDTYTTATNFGVASPSIKLDASGDAIVTEPLLHPDDLSFWVKGMGTDLSSYLLVEEYYLNKGAGWTEVTTVMPLPASGTNLGAFPLEFLTTDLRFTYLKSAGDLAFDDVGITLAAPSPTVTPTAPPTATPTPTAVPTASPTPPRDIPNPSFELEPALIGWTTVADKPTYVARSTDQFYDGIYSCTFSDTGYVTEKYTDQGIRSGEVFGISGGEEYDVGGWFFVDDEGGDITDTQFKFNIEWLSGGVVVSTDSESDWSLNDFATWENQSYRVTAPASADQVRIYLAAREISNNNNNVYIDYFSAIHAPAFSVTAPATGAAWYVGQVYNIVWESFQAPGNIDIHYSIDDGTNWISVASNIANAGTYPWVVPNNPSALARVRIRETGGGGVSGQSGRFRIAPVGSINVAAPVGGETWYRAASYDIEWTRGPVVSGDPVELAYSVNNGGAWTAITSVAVPIVPGIYSWTIPAENSSNCLVRVRQPASGREGISPAVFRIASPRFTVTQPSGGQYWYFGENQEITWTYTEGITGNVDIDYSVSGPSGPWQQIAANQPNSGSYQFWTIPNISTTEARVRISEVGGVSIPGVSANDFTLKGLTPPQPYVKLEWLEMPKIVTTCTLNSIEAFDPNNVWVGCACGIIYHWDGTQWDLQESCWNSYNNVGTNVNEFIAFAPDNVFGGGSGGVGVEYDGICWDPVVEAEKTIYSVDGPDATHILAGASSGTIAYIEPGDSWNVSTVGESGSLYGTVYLRPGEAYVARDSSTTYGVAVFTTRGGSITDWQTSYSDSGWGIPNHPLGGCIDQYGQTLLWLVGECGHLKHYNGSYWADQTKSGFNNFNCVEVLDENNVWAFAEGMIYHYNGLEWLIEQKGLSSIKQISAVDNRHVYGVTASKVYYTYSDPTPTPYKPTPIGHKTPSPTPVPQPGPIRGRVYDRITGAGVGNVYVRVYPTESGLRPAGDMTDSSGKYYIDGISSPLDAGVYQVFTQGSQGSGIRTYRDQWYNQKERQTQANLVASNSAGIDFPLYRVGIYPTPVPTATPFFSAVRVESGDYSGDGLSDLAIFRPASGLWAVRGVTRAYFGQAADIPVSGDYSGDGKADIAIFRSASGLWAVRGITRSYFGSAADVPVPGDYDGDGSADIGVFRSATGLWAVAGLGRSYFGGSGDVPVSGDYTGDGFMDIAIFRPASGLWAVKDVTRIYFGGFGDTPVPGDYDGLGMFGPAVFRSSSGLWAVRDVTRVHFGNSAYQAVPGSFAFPGLDEIGVFRPSSGLWAIQGLTRVYFGGSEDLPATR
ncbi:MAG: hypothetical protein P9M08_02475 [Candidatus Erginobacter occultus]|nr:hypothetical protein [Candidatus Erginobacter occultus]